MSEKIDNFNKRIIEVIVRGIKRSPDTMNFLEKQIKEIFLEEKSKWVSNQDLYDLYNPDFHGEYFYEVEKKTKKYLANWFYDISSRGYFNISNCPNSIVDGVNYLIQDLFEYMEEGLCDELSKTFTEKLFREEEEAYKADCIQKGGIPCT